MLPKSKFIDRMFLNVNNIYENGHFNVSSRVKRIAVKTSIALKWTLRNLHTVFSTSHIEMPYFEVMVTQKCNLKCKKCSNLIPLFSTPQDVPIDLLLDDIERVIKSVDRIYLLKILGGEPFLYRKLSELLNKIVDNPKIVKIELVTNGTILPRKDVVSSLTHPKIKLIVSPYGKMIAKKADVIIEFLKQNNIQYLSPDMETWTDFGGFMRRKRLLAENKKIFSQCSTCVTLIDGEIFCCPRAGNGAALGLVPKVTGEYVKVRDNHCDTIKKSLYVFSRLKVISTCDYCDNPGPEISIAEQI